MEERAHSIPVLGAVRGQELRDDAERHAGILVDGVLSWEGRARTRCGAGVHVAAKHLDAAPHTV
jgi:hypothetical protein